jgi:hypothetical protein
LQVGLIPAFAAKVLLKVLGAQDAINSFAKSGLHLCACHIFPRQDFESPDQT